MYTPHSRGYAGVALSDQFIVTLELFSYKLKERKLVWLVLNGLGPCLIIINIILVCDITLTANNFSSDTTQKRMSSDFAYFHICYREC